jgi:arylsulfatase A
LHAISLVVAVTAQFVSSERIVAEQPDHVNIVLIMADDVGYECFGCYGSDEYKTPRLDALAAGGIRFEHCHSTPLCTPSRVNLMSGKSNVFNYETFGSYPKGEPTFANHFKTHGYATAVAGKWQLRTKADGITPTEAGFDTYCVWNYPGTTRERYWNPSLIQDGRLLKLPRESYGPTVVTDFLIEFIQSNQQEPFLVYYPMILPHNPFLPTPDSTDRNSKDDKQNFIDMVGYVDTCVGRIEDALIQAGVRENTLLIFTGDNGTNEQITSNFSGTPIRGGKGYTRDHGTHVPLIVSLPGRIPAGQVNQDLVCFSDFFSTLVDAAGLPPKAIADGDGMSFWKQCLGNQRLGESGQKREWLYGYYFPRPYSNKFDNKYAHYEVRYARDKRYKLYDDGRLFDTVEDVLEETPLAITGALTPVRDKLKSALDRYPTKGRRIDYGRVQGTYSPKNRQR